MPTNHHDSPGDHKPLMRSLGEFFGHIWKGVKSDPTRKVLRTRTDEQTHDTPGGKVVLRRTTVEEVEIRARKD